MRAFAYNKINVAEMMISVSDRVENIVGNVENAVYQHFSFFPQCFQKHRLFFRVIKSWNCEVKSKYDCKNL